MGIALASGATADAQAPTDAIDAFSGLDGTAPSLQLDANGVGTVAYFNPGTSTINIARCADTNCSSAQVTSPVQISGDNSWPAMRLNPSGNPIVAYFDNGRIEVLRCNDAACAPGGDTIEVASDEANLIGFPALALSEAGFPTVAYIGPEATIRVVNCTTRSCSQTTNPQSPTPFIQTASVPVMIMGLNDRPIIAHTEWNGEGQPTPIHLLTCNSEECNQPVGLVERQGNFANLSLEIIHGPGNAEPVVHVGAALDTGANTRELRYFDCLVGLCGIGSELRARPVPSVVPERRAILPNMAISDDGPVFAYWDIDETGDVQVASVTTTAASSITGTRRVMAPSVDNDGFHWPDIEIHDGRATIATVDIDGLRVITCADSACVPVCNDQPVTVDIAAGGEYARAGEGDVVRGTMGGDTIVGGSVICALGGNDTITPSINASTFAGAGHDFINLASGKGFVSAGPGNDRVIGSPGLDRIFGGPGSDTLDGRGGTDRLSGGDGNDTISGGAGADQLFGNLGRDTIDGGEGNDIIKGGAWIDTVDGGAGDDDRCGIVAGEVRVNCERGVFGVGVVYGTCRAQQTGDGIEIVAEWTNTQQPANNVTLRRNGDAQENTTFASTLTFTDTDVNLADQFTYVVRYRVNGLNADVECSPITVESPSLGFDPFDVQFDPVRPLAYMTDRSARELHVVSLRTGSVTETIAFDHLPETLAVTPNGDELYVALPVQNHSSHVHDEQFGFVARFELGDDLGSPEIFRTDVDPFDIVATDDGYVVVSSGSGQWTEIESYDGRTGDKLSTGFIRQQSRLSLHPSQRIVYAADTDSGPSDIERFDLTVNGSLFGFGDSPYHGDHRMEGHVWASDDVLVTRGGDAFTSGRGGENDMVYLASLTQDVITEVDFDDTNEVVHVSTDSSIVSYDLNTFAQVGVQQLASPASFVDVQPDRMFVVSTTQDGSALTAIQR